MKPRAIFKRVAEDFVVDEIPCYPPSGEGEHLLVTVRKRDLSTPEAVSRLCAALGVDARSAGWAGMKDRRAITTQTVSVPFPSGRSPADALAVQTADLAVTAAVRHRHKIKPGHLEGNRFSIVLRDIPVSDIDQVAVDLVRIGRLGAPNAFGPQRFGRSGDNPERALAWLSGREPGPRDRGQRRLLFSALQSHLFNLVLARRIADGTWDRPLRGDLLKKHQSGGLFVCTDPTEDARRAAAFELSPTGPIFGPKMRWPEGMPAEIERSVLAEATDAANPFERHSGLGDGSRRSFRLLARELRVERVGNDPTSLRVDFVLPKGGYATTLLGAVVTLEEESP
jgi:tRNA pseudouridine13 synthase